MNRLLKFAQMVSSLLLVGAIGLAIGWGVGHLFVIVSKWIGTPYERYSDVVESVQDKAVMIEVPSVYTEITFTLKDNKMTVDESTVPVTFAGSGVVVTGSGAILSCAHLFETPITGPIIATLSDGTTVQALLLYADNEKDLALLKIKGHHSFASLSSKKLRLGQEVIAVGNPHLQQFSTSHGIISHLGRDIKEKYTYTQVDAPINPGNSGGPLFNLRGELIGINARGWTGSDGLALAIAPSTIREFFDLFEIK